MTVQTQSKLLWGDNQALLGEYLNIAKENPDFSDAEIAQAFQNTVRANVFSDFLSSLDHVVPEDTKLSDLPGIDVESALLDIEVNYFLDNLKYDLLRRPDVTVKTMLDEVVELLKQRPIMAYLLS